MEVVHDGTCVGWGVRVDDMDDLSRGLWVVGEKLGWRIVVG